MGIKKIYLTCPLRTLEADRLVNASDFDKSDFTIIGSCAVTREVEQMVIETIKSQNGDLIVFGCISPAIAAEINKKENTKSITTIQLKEFINKGSEVYPDIHKSNPTYFIESDSLCNRNYEDIAKHKQSFFKKLLGKRKNIPFLVIATGCNNQCTYCHTKFYIGNVNSKPQQSIVKEYKTLVNRNHNFINIISEDVGSYGIDIKSSLPELLTILDQVETKKPTHWMLDGLHPKWFIKYEKELSRFILSKRITAMSIPVQSGSDRILKLMNRNHNRDTAITILTNFRKNNPSLYLQGIFIVGFPSETEEDLNETIDFIKKVNFNDVTLIPYSEFNICESSAFENKIPQNTIYDRINRAKQLLKQLDIKLRD